MRERGIKFFQGFSIMTKEEFKHYYRDKKDEYYFVAIPYEEKTVIIYIKSINNAKFILRRCKDAFRVNSTRLIRSDKLIEVCSFAEFCNRYSF